MRFIICAAVLAVLPVAAQAGTKVSVEKPWVRYLLPNIPAAGYMILRNDGATDAVLIAAASPACGTLMLHKSQDESGMAMMMAVGTVNIPAHGAVSFSPGGYHLMCMSPRMKPGDRVTMVLTFQDGAKLNVSAPVYGAQTAP